MVDPSTGVVTLTCQPVQITVHVTGGTLDTIYIWDNQFTPPNQECHNASSCTWTGTPGDFFSVRLMNSTSFTATCPNENPQQSSFVDCFNLDTLPGGNYDVYVTIP